jgi:hypothetical protein
MLDVKNIVNEVLESSFNDEAVEKLIKDRVTKVIDESIKEALSSWDIKRKMEAKFKEEFGQAFDNISVKGYKSIVASQMMQIVERVAEEETTDKIKEYMESLWLDNTKDRKLSEIFSKVTEAFRETEPPFGLGSDENWTLHWYESSSELNIYFDQRHDKDREECEYHLRLNHYSWMNGAPFEKPRTVTQIKIAGIEYIGLGAKQIKNLSQLCDVDKLLLMIYLNDVKIDIDIDESDVDTAYYECMD